MLRFELSRHPRLRPAEDLPLKIQIIAPSGKEAAIETLLPANQLSRGVLLDASSLSDSGAELPSPLQVRITAVPEKGKFTEEHRLEI